MTLNIAIINGVSTTAAADKRRTAFTPQGNFSENVDKLFPAGEKSLVMFSGRSYEVDPHAYSQIGELIKDIGGRTFTTLTEQVKALFIALNDLLKQSFKAFQEKTQASFAQEVAKNQGKDLRNFRLEEAGNKMQFAADFTSSKGNTRKISFQFTPLNFLSIGYDNSEIDNPNCFEFKMPGNQVYWLGNFNKERDIYRILIRGDKASLPYKLLTGETRQNPNDDFLTKALKYLADSGFFSSKDRNLLQKPFSVDELSNVPPEEAAILLEYIIQATSAALEMFPDPDKGTGTIGKEVDVAAVSTSKNFRWIKKH